MNPNSHFENLFFSTVRISSKNILGKESVGTGFFVSQFLNDGTGFLFLCTAKHVIQDSQECVIFMHSGKDGKLQIANPIRVELDKYSDDWINHPTFDVTILNIGNIINDLRSRNSDPFFYTIDVDIIPTKDEIENYIDGVEDIFFVGYPDDKYDKVNMIPVMRKGITATPFQINYNGEPKFLIDASIYDGSSGSPVVICNPGSYSVKNKGLHKGSRNMFLGLISQGYRRMEDEQYIDLGICCKASLIKEMIYNLANSGGIILPERISKCFLH